MYSEVVADDEAVVEEDDEDANVTIETYIENVRENTTYFLWLLLIRLLLTRSFFNFSFFCLLSFFSLFSSLWSSLLFFFFKKKFLSLKKLKITNAKRWMKEKMVKNVVESDVKILKEMKNLDLEFWYQFDATWNWNRIWLGKLGFDDGKLINLEKNKRVRTSTPKLIHTDSQLIHDEKFQRKSQHHRVFQKITSYHNYKKYL